MSNEASVNGDGEDNNNYKVATEDEIHAIGGIDIKDLIAATAREELSAANYASHVSPQVKFLFIVMIQRKIQGVHISSR